jgi:hypothetical protein
VVVGGFDWILGGFDRASSRRIGVEERMSEAAKWYAVHTYSGYENKVATSRLKMPLKTEN